MARIWTTLDVLQWTIDYFKKRGIPHARVEAEVILAHALNIKRIDLYLQYDRPLSSQELSRCREFIKRRVKREPSQYIIGYREFWSLDFLVSPDVLIPRPETEILVERAIKYIKERSFKHIIDIGTGSGAVAVSIAHEVEDIEIVATDISFKALLVARKNADKHNVSSKIKFVASDLLKGISPKKHFDLIVSNPPYVSEEDYEKLDPEIRLYEPPEALLGGKDGLDIIKSLIKNGLKYLSDSGIMLIEIGYGQAEKIRDFITKNCQVKKITIITDYSGIQRVVCIEK